MDVLKKIELLEHEADDFGFRWETTEQIMAQIHSECLEIKEHLTENYALANQDLLQEEIGDLLHAVFSLCVFCNINPQTTLEKTANKFERRLHAVKQLAINNGLTTLAGHSFEDLMRYWNEAKRKVG